MRTLFLSWVVLLVCCLTMVIGCNSGINASSLAPGPSGSVLASSGSASGTSTSPADLQSSTFVFVNNAGTGSDLQAFRLNNDGSLVAVSESPYAHGSQMLGVGGGYLIAGSAGEMATYHIDAKSGTVSQVSSLVNGEPSIAGNDNFVYAGGSNAIYGYALTNGQLLPLPGFPYGVTANPCNCAAPVYSHLAVRNGYLFYSVNADHAGSWFEVKKIESDGTLSDVNTASCNKNSSDAINVTPDGRFIYSAAGALPSLEISVFDSNSGNLGCGQLTGPHDLFDSGVIDPGGHLLFAHQNFTSVEIGSYQIDSTTGQLTPAVSFPSSGQPEAIDPSGRYLLTIETPSATTFAIGVYSIDSSTGSLNQLGNYPLGSDSAAFFPVKLVVAQF